MFKYDRENKRLTIQKLDVKRPQQNIISDVHQSYNTYRFSTIKKDIKYLFEEVLSDDDIRYSVEVLLGDKRSNARKHVARSSYQYYPVKVLVTAHHVLQNMDEKINTEPIEIFEIPYMDEYGKVLTRSGAKVCLGILKPSEDASYDAETGEYNIAMPNANVCIVAEQKKTKFTIKVRFHGKFIDLDKVIAAMLFKNYNPDIDDFDLDADDIDFEYTAIPAQEKFCNIANNKIADLAKTVKPETESLHLYQDPVIHSFIKSITNGGNNASDMYNLGRTRESLNQLYDLHQIIGEVSAENVKDSDGNIIIPINKVLREEDRLLLHRNGINHINVWDNAINYSGFMLNEPIIIGYIPKGFPNNSYLKQMLPAYAQYDYFPEDVYSNTMEYSQLQGCEIPAPIIREYNFDNSIEVTAELIELYKLMGWNEMKVLIPSKEESYKEGTLFLYRDIIGNHFCKLKDLTSDIPNGMTADDWVYTYKNPAHIPAKYDPTGAISHLTLHDFEAIYSDLCHILQMDNDESGNLYNRDTAFMKRLALFDESMSKYFRETASRVYSSNKGRQRFIKHLKSNTIATELTEYVIKALVKNKILATPDTINITAEVCQTSHANIQMNEPPDVVRRLSIPYYSRICPFETPAGKQLGLVNTKAIGARVNPETHMLEAPYYKLGITSNGVRLTMDPNLIVWMTPKDEIGKKFVDLFDLNLEEIGHNQYRVLPGHMLARVPNIDKGEPFVVTRISTDDIDAHTYCNVYPEQILSPTAALIPCIGSDDATRVTYGLAQLKQTIYLQESEPPMVSTFMYRDIFNYVEDEGMTSPFNGTVVSVDNMDVTIQDDETGDTVLLCGDRNTMYKDLDEKYSVHYTSSDKARMAFPLVKPGQHVNKGDIIIKAGVYPKPFLTLSPVAGEVTHISHDAITIRSNQADKNWNPMVPNPDDIEHIVCFQGIRIARESILFSDVKVKVGDHVDIGDILVETSMSHKGVYSPSRNSLIAYIPYGYNHEDGVVLTEKAADAYTSIICNTITTKRPYNAKVRTIGKPSSYKYNKPGDKILSIPLSVSDSRNQNNGNFKVPTKDVYATDQKNGIIIDTAYVYNADGSSNYETYMLGVNRAQEGDKFAGRHGNKGVCSKVLKDSEAPQFLNGVIPDVILNPHGVPSRMNLGQIDDCHLGLAAYMFNVEIRSDPFNGATPEEISVLVHLAHDASTWIAESTVNSVQSFIQRVQAMDEYRYAELPIEFLEDIYMNPDRLLEWYGAFNRDGTAPMYDPVTDTYYRTPVTFGWAYYNKLEQEVDSKIKHRAGPLVGEYSSTTSQPHDADSAPKGQRLGEMELMNLVTYGAAGVLDESLNEKCDNLGKSFNKHAEQLGYPERVQDKYCLARSVENLLTMLMGLGVKPVIDPNFLDVSCIETGRKQIYDLETVVRNRSLPVKNHNEKIITSSSEEQKSIFKR